MRVVTLFAAGDGAETRRTGALDHGTLGYTHELDLTSGAGFHV